VGNLEWELLNKMLFSQLEHLGSAEYPVSVG